MTYNWSPGGETISTITAQPATTTTYTVDVTSGTTTCQDSVIVSVNPIDDVTIDSTVCDSVLWAGDWLTTSGTYYDTLQNMAGCDSIVTLSLTTYYTTSSDTAAIVCGSLLWHGLTYTSSGTYYDTLQTINGCDSVVKLSLTINPQDDASFSYSASSYCSDDTDPTPAILGTAGGTFSSTTGIVMTNGVIDLDASTAGTYTIKYVTPGICSDSSTARCDYHYS